MNFLPKIAPTIFVHFKNPATDEPLYVLKERTNPDTDQVELVRALDEDGKEKPIGVMAYTPGSKVYRSAEQMNATENIAAGKKGLTGGKLFDQQTKLLARTVYKYVNFDVDGQGANYETNMKFFNDEENEAMRVQVQNDQADLGKSLKPAAKG